MRRGIQRVRREKRGATLVELLVTFALLAMFLTSAAAVISPATRIFLNMKYQSYAQNVSDILLEKVCGEISSASADKMVIDTGGKLISFSDSKASPMYIGLSASVQPDEGNTSPDTGYLLLHYRTIYSAEEGTRVLWPAVNWKYDLNAYHGFEISSLTFAPIGTNGNTVQVTMELKHTRFNVQHRAERVVECYNLKDKVETGKVYTDDDEFWDNKN